MSDWIQPSHLGPVGMVLVPLELLRTVLDDAEYNSFAVENEFCTGLNETHWQEERARIDQLRAAAGIMPDPQAVQDAAAEDSAD